MSWARGPLSAASPWWSVNVVLAGLLDAWDDRMTSSRSTATTQPRRPSASRHTNAQRRADGSSWRGASRLSRRPARLTVSRRGAAQCSAWIARAAVCELSKVIWRISPAWGTSPLPSPSGAERDFKRVPALLFLSPLQVERGRGGLLANCRIRLNITTEHLRVSG